MTTLTSALGRVVYATRDGKPMAETDKHREIAFYIIQALKTYFAPRSDVYVSGNNFVFWEEGNPKARISPDAYVVFGPTPDLRDSYMAWKDGGHLPGVVFEFTSRKTQREDTDSKLPLYENVLKTPEYFLFDPTGDYLKPRLQGCRLAEGRYARLELVSARLHNEQLGLDVVPQGEDLRRYDPQRQEFLPTNLEMARQVATSASEIERLRAELAAFRQNAHGKNDADTE